MKNRILIFDPNAGIRTHARMIELVARNLSKSAEVLLLRCDGVFFGGCTLHLTYPDDNRESLCKRCMGHSSFLSSWPGYEMKSVEALLDLNEATGVKDNLASLSLRELEAYCFLELPIGKFASYELLLNLKIGKLDDQHVEIYRSAVLAAHLSALAGSTILPNFRPHSVITMGRQYGVQRAFCGVAKALGTQVLNINTYGTHRNREFGFLASFSDYEHHTHLDERFRRAMAVPVSRSEGRQIIHHFNSAVRGESVFSYSAERRAITREEVYLGLGLDAKKPTVSILMSSPDEPAAASASGFMNPMLSLPVDESYIELLLKVIEAIPEVQFVFRIHPRLFANRRESVVSPLGSRIKSLLEREQKQKSNLFINSPEDSIGLYDLARVTDLAISYRSNAGQELGVLGVPVIQLDQSRDPIAAIRSEPPTVHDYRSLAEAVVSRLGNTNENEARLLLRWMVTDRLRLPVPIKTSKLKAIVLALRIKVSKRLRERNQGLGPYLGVTRIGGKRVGRITDVDLTIARWVNWLGLPKRSTLHDEGRILRGLRSRFLS